MINILNILFQAAINNAAAIWGGGVFQELGTWVYGRPGKFGERRIDLELRARDLKETTRMFN